MARTVDDCDKFVLASGDYFLQSLPLKGLMKFLPNLLSILCRCFFKKNDEQPLAKVWDESKNQYGMSWHLVRGFAVFQTTTYVRRAT